MLEHAAVGKTFEGRNERFGCRANARETYGGVADPSRRSGEGAERNDSARPRLAQEDQLQSRTIQLAGVRHRGGTTGKSGGGFQIPGPVSLTFPITTAGDFLDHHADPVPPEEERVELPGINPDSGARCVSLDRLPGHACLLPREADDLNTIEHGWEAGGLLTGATPGRGECRDSRIRNPRLKITTSCAQHSTSNLQVCGPSLKPAPERGRPCPRVWM